MKRRGAVARRLDVLLRVAIPCLLFGFSRPVVAEYFFLPHCKIVYFQMTGKELAYESTLFPIEALRELLAKQRNGDAAAAEELNRQLTGLVFPGIVVQLRKQNVHDTNLVMDVLQNVLITAYQKLDEREIVHSVYFVGLARKMAYQHMFRINRSGSDAAKVFTFTDVKEKVRTEGPRLRAVNFKKGGFGEKVEPWKGLAVRELADELNHLAESLSEQERNIFFARLDGSPYAELAAEHETNEHNVRQIYSRTIAKLKKSLKEKFEGFDPQTLNLGPDGFFVRRSDEVDE